MDVFELIKIHPAFLPGIIMMMAYAWFRYGSGNEAEGTYLPVEIFVLYRIYWGWKKRDPSHGCILID